MFGTLVLVIALLHSESVQDGLKVCTYRAHSQYGEYHSIKVDKWRPCPPFIQIER